MTKSTTVITQKKKRGPKPTGKGTLIGLRLQPDLLKRIDALRREQDDFPSRPEAIRRILAEHLEVEEG